MSKGLGKKIAIQFTEKLTTVNETESTSIESKNGQYILNGTYSGSLAELQDDNTSSYWQSRSTGNYILVGVEGIEIKGFSVYKGSSYRPTTYVLESSEDGVGFNQILSGSFIAATGWEQILLPSPIFTKFIRVKFGYSSRLYLYEFRLVIMGYAHIGDDFIIEWSERKHVGGSLLNKTAKPKRISRHPSNPEYAILLETPDTQRFNNVEGNLMVSYDQTKGSLQGRGGPVESFSHMFTPTELAPKPNPHAAEHLAISASTDIGFLKVTYNKAYADETITVSATAVVDLIHVDDINP